MNTLNVAVRVLPRPLLAALHAVLFAAVAVISGVRWWHGEPLFLRVALCTCYGWCALVAAAIAVVLRARDTGGDAP